MSKATDGPAQSSQTSCSWASLQGLFETGRIMVVGEVERTNTVTHKQTPEPKAVVPKLTWDMMPLVASSSCSPESQQLGSHKIQNAHHEKQDGGIQIS